MLSAEIIDLEYDFIDNGNGDVMMLIQAVPDSPDAPVFYFDGLNAALFKRKDDQIAPIAYIPAKVRKLLTQIEQILVVEMNDDEEFGEVYKAPVIIPENGILPYPQEMLEDVNPEILKNGENNA